MQFGIEERNLELLQQASKFRAQAACESLNIEKERLQFKEDLL